MQKDNSKSYAVTITNEAKAKSREFAKTPAGQAQLAHTKAEITQIRADQAERMSMNETEKEVQSEKQR